MTTIEPHRGHRQSNNEIHIESVFIKVATDQMQVPIGLAPAVVEWRQKVRGIQKRSQEGWMVTVESANLAAVP